MPGYPPPERKGDFQVEGKDSKSPGSKGEYDTADQQQNEDNSQFSIHDNSSGVIIHSIMQITC